MTREIKFKIWDTIDKKWLENFTVYQYGNVSSNGEWLETNTVIKCQFTGLLDKNGKPIYEGDIVEALLPQREPIEIQRMAVEWEHGGFILANNAYAIGIQDLDEYKAINIIGNRYENPDLLPQSKIN